MSVMEPPDTSVQTAPSLAAKPRSTMLRDTRSRGDVDSVVKGRIFRHRGRRGAPARAPRRAGPARPESPPSDATDFLIPTRLEDTDLLGHKRKIPYRSLAQDGAFLPPPYAYDGSLAKTASQVSLAEEGVAVAEVVARVAGPIASLVTDHETHKQRTRRLRTRQRDELARRVHKERSWDSDFHLSRSRHNNGTYVGKRNLFQRFPRNQTPPSKHRSRTMQNKKASEAALRTVDKISEEWVAKHGGIDGNDVPSHGPSTANTNMSRVTAARAKASGVGSTRVVRQPHEILDTRFPQKTRMQQLRKGEHIKEALWEERFAVAPSKFNHLLPKGRREYFDEPRSMPHDTGTTPRTITPSLKLHPADVGAFHATPAPPANATRQQQLNAIRAGVAPPGSMSARTAKELQQAEATAMLGSDVPRTDRVDRGVAEVTAAQLRLRQNSRRSPRVVKREHAWDDGWVRGPGPLSPPKRKPGARRVGGGKNSTGSPRRARGRLLETAQTNEMRQLEQMDRMLSRGDFAGVGDLTVTQLYTELVSAAGSATASQVEGSVMTAGDGGVDGDGAVAGDAGFMQQAPRVPFPPPARKSTASEQSAETIESGDDHGDGDRDGGDGRGGSGSGESGESTDDREELASDEEYVADRVPEVVPEGDDDDDEDEDDGYGDEKFEAP